MNATLSQTTFPATGQRVRVVTIDGEPWFATMDVCRILGHSNPTRASKIVSPDETLTVNQHDIFLTSGSENRVSAGGNEYRRGTPRLNLVSESGLYKLIMRSDKPSARPFQDWVTRELLPEIRRGQADSGRQRERMAETLVDALDLGEQLLTTVTLDGQVFEVRKDGLLRCRHGLMELVAPPPGEEVGPPHGPYYQCTQVQRVGIHGSRSVRVCRTVHAVEVTRAVANRPTAVEVPQQRQAEGALHIRLLEGLGPADEVIRLCREFWQS